MTPNDREWLELAWSQLWQVTALAVLVGALTRFGCRRRPHLAYVLWMLVVLKCLAPPLWSSPTGLFSWAQCRTEGRTLPKQITDPAVTIESSSVPPRLPLPRSLPATAKPPEPRHSETAARSFEIPAEPLPAAGWRWRLPFSPAVFVLAVWLTGAAVLAVVVLKRWLRFCRALSSTRASTDPAIQALAGELARRLGVRQSIVIRVTREPIGPAVFGFQRVVIVLPQTLLENKSPREIEPILAHELIHVRRGDLLWGATQVLTELIWWFHPLIWWANREACRERERCCDEEVIAELPCRPAVYARCLLDVLELERAWRPMLVVPGVRSVEVTTRRLEDIMTQTKRFHRRTPAWCWAIFVALAALILPGKRLALSNAAATGNERPEQSAVVSKTSDEESPGKTVVAGQVLDERGNAVAEARVAVVGRPRTLEGEYKTLGVTTADAQGRYRLAVSALSSATCYKVSVIALAAGHAIVSQPVPLDVKRPEVVIRLPDEQVLRGRVIDPKGFPAAKVKVHVRGVETKGQGDSEGVFVWEPEKAPAVWPQPSTTDNQGRFALHGVNTTMGAHVQVIDDRFARWHFDIGRPGSGESAAEGRVKYPSTAIGGDFVPQTGPADEITLAPPPSQILEGQVIHEDTKQPAAHAGVAVYARDQNPLGSAIGVFGQADAAGRFRLNPFPGRFFDVAASPAEGEPYLIRQKTVEWPDSTEVYRMEVAVPRGMLVRGKINESPSGKPVEGANIQYEPRSGNPNIKEDILTGWRSAVVSRADGTFQIVVPPGKGSLVIQGQPGYVFRVFGSQQINSSLPGGKRYYLHAMIPLDLDPQATPEVNATLKRGVTVRGRLVGPDNKPVGEALLNSYLFIAPLHREWNARSPLVVRGGQFELHGLDPEKPTPVYVLDAKDQWGAKLQVSGRNDDDPLVVRLLPCGAAEVRFVDVKGKPVVGYQPELIIVLTPGASHLVAPAASEAREFLADEEINNNFDRLHYWDGIRTDKDGRCVLPALIPGAAYRLFFESPSGKNAVLDFTAESGKAIKLRDVVVKRPVDGRAE